MRCRKRKLCQLQATDIGRLPEDVIEACLNLDGGVLKVLCLRFFEWSATTGQ